MFRRAAGMSPEERKQLLEETGADTAVRHELEELLEINDRTGFTAEFGGIVNDVFSNWSDASTIKEGQRVSEFTLLKQIGRGGMGRVFIGHDSRLKRDVALKFLAPAFGIDLGAKKRLLQEARAASGLDHPNICTIYQVGETDGGQLYIVMALYQGETLKDKIDQGPLPLDEALDIALQTAKGLAEAHDRGVVHRDVKPANIMITEKGLVKILDFGIAKMADIQLTREGARLGTLAYMSPEQARGMGVDALSDVWALGVVLYEMITGRRPFYGECPEAVIYNILNQSFIVDSAFRIPGPLVGVIQKALEKTKDLRIPDMAGFVEVLERIRANRELPSLETFKKTSIAVLPFADMSAARDQDYFCEGVAEGILNALARVRTFRVASRTSSFLFKNVELDAQGIGKRLNVESVLEGSVRKAGNRLRITVQLIDAGNGYHLWSGQYDRENSDIFAVQDDIAEQVVESLSGVLSEEERDRIKVTPEAEFEAYDYYLRGKNFLHRLRRVDLNEARRLFEKAIEVDPNYAPAFAALTFCCYYLFQWFGQSDRHRAEADRASRRAVELAPSLAEPHVARGLALALYAHFEEAEDAFEKALLINPNQYEANYFFARINFMQGKFERTAELFKRASELDPQEFQATTLRGMALRRLGKPEAALKQYEEGLRRIHQRLELNPDGVRAVNLGGLALIKTGQEERGLRWIARTVEMEPEDPVVIWNAACAYSVAGDYENAFDCLERAIELGIANRRWLENDDDMDPIRSTLRFQKLLDAMTPPK